jgi:hypothetical protein
MDLHQRGDAATNAVGLAKSGMKSAWHWLVVLCLLTMSATAAQAANIQQWVGVHAMFHTAVSQPSDLVYHESIEAAFAYAKTIYERCNNQTSPPTCWTYTNLRPDPGPLGQIRYNGVAYYWITDKVTCQGQSCTTGSGLASLL